MAESERVEEFEGIIMRLTIVFLLFAVSSWAWNCPPHDPPYKKIGETNTKGQITVYCELDQVVYQMVVGPQGPPGPPGANGKDGKDGQNGKDGKDLTKVFKPLDWIGWEPVGNATAQPFEEDGVVTKVLITCRDIGICGFTHELDPEGINRVIKIRPSFDPIYLETSIASFGVVSSDAAQSLLGVEFTSTGGMALYPHGGAVPNPHEFWIRAKENFLSYSSDGIVWYNLAPIIGGDKYFIGTTTGIGTFWIEEWRK